MRQKKIQDIFSTLAAMFASAILLIGCAGTLSSVEMSFPNSSRSDLMAVAQRSLMSLGTR